MFAENGSWQERYMQTILEVSGQTMPERITATRQAIAGRCETLNTTATITRRDTRSRRR